jgi:DNA invertase Pin-like site-specific DNA recombinase
MKRPKIRGLSAAGAKRAEGLARYRHDYAAGRVGQDVHSRSGRDLPPHRPKVEVNQPAIESLRHQGKSLRAIAKQLGLGLGTVARALQSRSNTFGGHPLNELDSAC